MADSAEKRASSTPRTRRRHAPNVASSARPRSAVKLKTVSAMGPSVGATRTRARSPGVR
ncbi:hypothetical protein [Nonomuraea sp. NPDC005692]|uniref:hypothetical protein n=1 Tax=Nonomuraea sp. NPDC005692 TaxID=3157168 RepID=UPI0034103C51